MYDDKTKQELLDAVEKLLGRYGSVSVVASLSDLFAKDAAEYNQKPFKQQAQLFRDVVSQLEPIVKYKVQEIYGEPKLKPSNPEPKPGKFILVYFEPGS